MHRKIFYSFLLFVLLATCIQASGRIRGTVVDLQTGDPLIGANVIVVGTNTGAATDANGEFILLNLEAGEYNVRATFIGYQEVTLQNVRVNDDLTTYIEFELPSQDIEVGTVEILAEKPLIQKDATNAVRITNSEDIEALPVRGVNNLYTLTAGVTESNDDLHIRGGRADEVGYYLEGVSVKNPITGANAVNISQDALEEIQIQSGGYTAEFGDANSGIIRQQLKTGGNQFNASFEYITDNISFQPKSEAFNGEKRLGAHWYGYNEMSGVISGPVLSDNVKFFGNVNYVFERDAGRFIGDSGYEALPGVNIGRVYDPFSTDTVNLVYPAGPRPNNRDEVYTFTGTLNFDFNPFLIRLSANHSIRSSDAGPFGITDFLNTRVGQRDETNGMYSLKLTHVVNPNFYYELNGGLFLRDVKIYDKYLQDAYPDDPWVYGDSLKNAEVGWEWERTPKDYDEGDYGRYNMPDPYSIFIWDFQRDGVIDNTSRYQKTDYTGINLSANFSWMIGKTHSIKFGGEYKQYTLRRWDITGLLPESMTQQLATKLSEELGIPRADLDLDAIDEATKNEAKEELMVSYGADNYGYDLLGNEIDDHPLYAPHKPVFAGAYVQDRIEYEDLILNVGLRFDYFDIDNKQFVDPTDPSQTINQNTKVIDPDGLEDVPSFSAVSPRLGLSFPVTDRTVFHAQYGKFVQQPRLDDVYTGYHRIAYMLTTGYWFGEQFTGPNIRPTRTTQYELGFSQQLTDFLSVDITGYYKDIKDQVIFMNQPTEVQSGFASYFIKTNGDFATTKGIELTMNMRRYERLLINGNVAFQDAQGTGSHPGSNVGIFGAPLSNVYFIPKYTAPLDFNRDFTANLNLDYRFGPDDGPSVLHNFGVSVLMQYETGKPYTLGTGDPTQIGITVPNDGDARGRRPLEPLNSSQMSSSFNVDLRIDKTFNLIDRLNLNVYVFVLNLFDNRNVENVFVKTGSPDDDGYTTDPTIIAQQTELYGDQFIDIYRAINVENDSRIYGQSRQIRLGIRLEY